MAWNPNRRLGQAFLDDEEYDPTVQDLSVAERIAAENGDPPPEPPPQVPGRMMAPPPQIPPPPPPQLQAPPPNPGPPPPPQNGPSQGPPPQLPPSGTPLGGMPPNPGPPPPDRTTTNIQVPGQGPLPPQGLGAGSIGPGAPMPPAYQLPPVPQPGAYTFSGDKPIQHPSVLRRIGGALLGYASGEGIPGMVRGAMRPGYEQAVQRAGMEAGMTERQMKLNQEAVKTAQMQSEIPLNQAKTEESRAQGKHYGEMSELAKQAREDAALTAAAARTDSANLRMDESLRKLYGEDAFEQEAGKPVPPGYASTPLASSPGRVLVHPPPMVILSPDLAPFAKGRKAGDPIPYSEFKKLQELASKPGKEVSNPDQVLLNPSAYSPEQVKKAQDLFDKAHRPPQGPQTTVFVPGPDGTATAQLVKPGQSVPAGAVTATGLNTQNIPTSNTRSMAEKAPRVIDFVDRINGLLDANEQQIGPLVSRWNEFTAGKVGLPNKGYTQLRTDARLLETALMNMHVGARGGEKMMEHFRDLINTATQSPENLRAALGEIRDYATRVASEGRANAGGTQPQGVGAGVRGGRGGGQAAIPQQPPPNVAQSLPVGETKFRNGQVWQKKADGSMVFVRQEPQK